MVNPTWDLRAPDEKKIRELSRAEIEELVKRTKEMRQKGEDVQPLMQGAQGEWLALNLEESRKRIREAGQTEQLTVTEEIKRLNQLNQIVKTLSPGNQTVEKNPTMGTK